jgi:hypothetical protein
MTSFKSVHFICYLAIVNINDNNKNEYTLVYTEKQNELFKEYYDKKYYDENNNYLDHIQVNNQDNLFRIKLSILLEKYYQFSIDNEYVYIIEYQKLMKIINSCL